MGNVAGIGPEIITKALAHQEVYEKCRPLVIGNASILEKVLPIVDSNLKISSITTPEDAIFEHGTIDVIDFQLLPQDLPFGEVSGKAGDAAYQYLAKATELAKNKAIDSICTAPLNKEALHKGGHIYPGHTEVLADLTDTTDFFHDVNDTKLTSNPFNNSYRVNSSNREYQSGTNLHGRKIIT